MSRHPPHRHRRRRQRQAPLAALEAVTHFTNSPPQHYHLPNVLHHPTQLHHLQRQRRPRWKKKHGIGPVLSLEPLSSTVKHVDWVWPACLVGSGGAYNNSLHQSFRWNGTEYYTVFDLPVSVTDSIDESPSRVDCALVENPLRDAVLVSSSSDPLPGEPWVGTGNSSSNSIGTLTSPGSGGVSIGGSSSTGSTGGGGGGGTLTTLPKSGSWALRVGNNSDRFIVMISSIILSFVVWCWS